MKVKSLFAIVLIIFGCNSQPSKDKNTVAADKHHPFMWENANIYFLLTDRFLNGDSTNDSSYGRKKDGAKLRSYEGGDFRGVIQKIEEGYFDRLGITALWITPPIENIHSFVDEGTGKTYGYHGYWTRDWTNIDANLGTMEEYKELINIAHQHGIRVLMDVIINHTGPHTLEDSAWPEEWVRQGPNCTYQDFESNVTCTLVSHLADIRTESDEPVELPSFLIKKWKLDGRYEKEMKELDEFFSRTGYPRAPRFYIIKWLTDYVREFGIDGFRVDTAKHVEPSVWNELLKEAALAFEEWKRNHPKEKLDDHPFYSVAEIYNYSIQMGTGFSMGDTIINYYDYGFSALINFSLKSDATKEYEAFFSEFSSILTEGELKEYSTLNYLDSHDDGNPFDALRKKPFESGTKLLLAPGASQVYYGDETARLLVAEGTNGDANLRTNMNWDDLTINAKQEGYFISDVYDHYSKLGTFRKLHLAVGAGTHKMLQQSPYTFSRVLDKRGITDKVIVVLDKTTEAIDVSSVFKDGTQVTDYYSGSVTTVEKGKVSFDTGNDILLIGE